MLYRLVTTILLLTLLFSPLSLHAQGGRIIGGKLTDPKPAVTVALANASFETGADAPDNWTPLTEHVGGNYLWDTEVFSTGKRSISTHSSRWRYGRWTSDAIAVESSGFQWYTLTGKVETHANNGEVYLSIAWYDTDGARISTSDSPMLPEGDNDWTTLTVSALPPDGAVKLSVWCISNHNAGQTWFDGLELKRIHFPAVKGTTLQSYEQFIIKRPTHRLAVEANVMQVRELMTQAKWTRESDFYNTEKQLQASQLYAEAAGIRRRDAVFSGVFAALHQDSEQRAEALAAAKARFDRLIDESWQYAAQMAEVGGDRKKLKEYLSKLLERVSDTEAAARIRQRIEQISD